MIELEIKSDIDAPPETVFEFIADPHNHTKILPSLVEVSNVEETDTGKEGRYVFNMVGQEIDGGFSDTEFESPNRRAYETTGGLEGEVRWTIEGTNEGAHVTYEQETVVPGPELFDVVTDPVARTFLQREADTMIENLRTLVEEGVTATS
jgi:carbon monoxide dehydrogenase subunit G